MRNKIKSRERFSERRNNIADLGPMITGDRILYNIYLWHRDSNDIFLWVPGPDSGNFGPKLQNIFIPTSACQSC